MTRTTWVLTGIIGLLALNLFVSAADADPQTAQHGHHDCGAAVYHMPATENPEVARIYATTVLAAEYLRHREAGGTVTTGLLANMVEELSKQLR